MSSTDKISTGQLYQLRLTIEEWMASEFERVNIQCSEIFDVIDQVRFLGVNGLIQRENKKISPFFFKILNENGEDFLIIVFSIPVFQSLDSLALQTGMEYFGAILKHMLCEKQPAFESEIRAFSDIKKLLPVRVQNKEIIPYEDFTEKLEIQLRMRVRMGLQIIPVTTIEETYKTGRIRYLAELRKCKRALANIHANLKEYSKIIAKRYRINVDGFLFQTTLENQFEPLIIPIFTLHSKNRVNEDFSVLVLTEAVVNRVTPRQLEIMLAHEILFDLIRGKFSRGVIEKEIFLILSEDKDDPEYLIEKEMRKFFDLKEIKNTQEQIQSIVQELSDSKYSLLKLE